MTEIEYESIVNIKAPLTVAGRVTSGLPDGGLSPFDVLSQVWNQNMNVDFLDGYHAAAFPRKAENATIAGSWVYSVAPSITTPGTNPSSVATYGQITALSSTVITGSGTAGKFAKFSAAKIVTDSSYLSEVAGAVKSASSIQVDFPSAGGLVGYYLQTNGLNRWFHGKYQVEGGSNTGSNMALSHFDDLGNQLGNVYLVDRATGVLTFQNVVKGVTPVSAADLVTKGFFDARQLTVAGTSGRISVTGGTQSFLFDRTWTADLVATGIAAGTYRSATYDIYGRATSGTNPTTVAGYGITDILSQPLTGYTIGSNAALTAIDTLLGGFGKLQGQVTAVNVKGSSVLADADLIPDTGFYYGDAATLNSPFIHATFIEAKRAANRRGQIAMDSYVGNGKMFVRSQGAGNVMSSWYEVVTAGSQGTLTRGTGLIGGNYTPLTAATWSVDFGTSHTQAAYGDHTHAALTAGTGLSGTAYTGSAAQTWSVAYGTTAGTATQGNDTRVNNGQTAFTWGTHTGLYMPKNAVYFSDADLIPGSGFYYADAATTNIPYIFASVFEMNRTTNRRGQIAIDAYYGSGRMSVRSQGLGGSMSPWYDVITTGNQATLTRGAGLTGSNYTPSSAASWAVDFGTSSGQVTQGNDSRVNNGQTAFGWGNHAGLYSLVSHTHSFASLTLKPSSLSGYGITDAYPLSGNPSAFISGGGTTNYVMKYTGSATGGNSRIFDAGSGDVQIGAGLSVTSTINIASGDIIFAGSGGVISSGFLYGSQIRTNFGVIGGGSLSSGITFQINGTGGAMKPPTLTHAQKLTLSSTYSLPYGAMIIQDDTVGASVAGVKFWRGSFWSHLDYNDAAG